MIDMNMAAMSYSQAAHRAERRLCVSYFGEVAGIYARAASNGALKGRA